MTQGYPELSRQKILITGASGFIGGRLCQKLVRSGATVSGTSRKSVPGITHAVSWHYGDLADYRFVRNLLQEIRPDFIIHLASQVLGSRDLKYVMTTFENNLVSTINLLNAAAGIGCERIILAGSMEEPESKNGAAIPSSPYAAAKWAGSMYGRLFHTLYQLPVVLARIFMVYGPGQMDLNKLIPYTILSLLKKEHPHFSSGVRQIDWIFVDDVVDGLIAMLLAPDLAGQQIDLGSGHLISIRQIVEQVFGLLQHPERPEFGGLPERPYEQIREADVEDTKRKLNWIPQYSLESGLELTVNWYKNFYQESHE